MTLAHILSAGRWPRAAMLAVALLCGAGVAAQPVGGDELVQVRRKGVTAVHLRPGADFRPYAKLIIEQASVAFHPEWFRELNAPVRSPREHIRPEETDLILADMHKAFNEAFPEALFAMGVVGVPTAAPDVLQLRPRVEDLVVSVPTVDMRNYVDKRRVETAGRAVLVLEIRDSTSGVVLARIRDKRETRPGYERMFATRESNIREFRLLFERWAELVARELQDLQRRSPLPETLKPGKKLPD